MKLKDAALRAARSAAQAFVAAFVLVKPAADLAGLRDQALNYATSFGIACLFAGATFVVSFVQNFAEDNTRFQAPK